MEMYCMIKMTLEISGEMIDCLEDGAENQPISGTYLTQTFAADIFLEKNTTGFL